MPGGETVPPNSIQFTVHGDWDLEESVLSAHDCGESPADGGEGVCPLVVTPGHPDQATIPARITMRYLGSSLESDRVAGVVVRNPGEDVNADLQTCANVRIALPHDPRPTCSVSGNPPPICGTDPIDP